MGELFNDDNNYSCKSKYRAANNTASKSNKENFLNILSLNVCGLESKKVTPEFLDFISKYDIIGFQETKTNQFDTIELNDFNICFKNRSDISKKRSGGIALAYKKNLENFITVLETKSSLALWFVVSKRLTRNDDILCGIVYIPPYGTRYSVEDPFF